MVLRRELGRNTVDEKYVAVGIGVGYQEDPCWGKKIKPTGSGGGGGGGQWTKNMLRWELEWGIRKIRVGLKNQTHRTLSLVSHFLPVLFSET